MIPDDLTLDGFRDSVKVVILRCGYRALNYFFNLRRRSLTDNQIGHLIKEVQSLNYDYLLLYRMKQVFLKETKNYGGKKRMSQLKNVCHE